MIQEPDASWRVGELAEATGMTVRALHHYEAMKLMVPTNRTSGGHRLYGPAAVVPLQPEIQQNISIPIYADLQAAYEYLAKVYRLAPGTVTKNSAGIQHAVLHAGHDEFWLHCHHGRARRRR